MSEVVHADIFFFITGIAVIVISAILVVVLFHTIKVLKGIRRITDRIEAETEAIADDIQNVRTFIAHIGVLPQLIASLMGRKESTKTRTQSGHKARRTGELSIKDQA